MNLVQITPGAGGMYCGNCFRDNALVAALRRRGHEVLMVPLYLPMTLDEPSQAAGVPTFFGGINVYLQQQSAFFRRAPKWLHALLDSPALLKLAAGRAAKTRAADVGELSLSMLRGEEGNQARELDELLAWLKTQPKPDAVLLSNAMLVGFTRRLKAELGCQVVCNLQGEDAYLDSMPSPMRERVWALLAERCRDCDAFIAPSRYFADTMARRLGLPAEKVKVVFNGISLEGYSRIQNPESRIQNRKLFILEEPTIGLHMSDVQRLVEVLQRLVDAGHSVIVIEHNLDLIAEADWVIDLGPEAGNAGGELVAEGTPEQIAKGVRSHTGRFLRSLMRL